MTATKPSLVLAALLIGGCYSGVDTGLGGPQVADGDGGAPTRTPTSSPGDGGDGGGGDSDGTPNEPDPDEEPPFELSGNAVELLPFHVRLANLERVVGVAADHFIFTELRRQRFLLGDHDYAAGIAPDLRWSPQKMQVWVKALVPVCESNEFNTSYATLLEDPVPLVRAAYGRNPTDDELEGFAEIAAGTPNLDSRYQLTCLAVLSALPFVAT